MTIAVRHAHIYPGPACVWILVDDTTPIATARDKTTACRIAELLDRHGLADIPDTIPDQ